MIYIYIGINGLRFKRYVDSFKKETKESLFEIFRVESMIIFVNMCIMDD